MEKTLNDVNDSTKIINEVLAEANKKNDKSVMKTYSFDEALVEATKYFKGDELAANV